MGEPTKINKNAALKILEESGFERAEELESTAQVFVKTMNGTVRLLPSESLVIYVLIWRRPSVMGYCVLNGGWSLTMSAPLKSILVRKVAQPVMGFKELVMTANNLPLEEKVFSGETFNKIFSDKNVVSSHEIIKAWNAYCGENDPEGGSSDDYRRIFSMDDLPDETAGMSTFALIDAIQEGDFNVRHNYWCFGPGGNEQLYSFNLDFDAVHGKHSPIPTEWLAEYMNRNGWLWEKEKAPRLEQKSYWAATYYSLCDHDQSIELYRSRQEAIDGVIKSLNDTSEDYTQEVLDECRSALDEHEFWDNPCTDEIIRIDTASFCD